MIFSVIFLLCMMLIISGLSFQVGYSQDEMGDKKVKSQISLQTWEGGYAELNATDFTLTYPIDWNAFNSSPSPEFESYSIENPIAGLIQISITQFDEQAVPTSGLSRKLVQERNDSNLPEIFPWAINTIQSGFEKGVTSEPEQISYDNYLVDGYKMGSAQFNVSYTDSTLRVLLLSNIVYNKGFVFAYAAPLGQFDQHLPMIEEIIDTVRFND